MIKRKNYNFDSVSYELCIIDDLLLKSSLLNNMKIRKSHFRGFRMKKSDCSYAKFSKSKLCGAVFKNSDLSQVRIEDCNIDGMTIDGYLVTELIRMAKWKEAADETG